MEDEQLLSAEEGADRVADRWKAHRLDRAPRAGSEDLAQGETGSEDDENFTPVYTCENCGTHTFLFYRTFSVERTIQNLLECGCGETEMAAVRDLIHRRQITHVGRLGPDHQTNYQDEEYGDETIDDEEWEEVESNVDCEKCLAEARDEDWSSEELEGWEEDGESLWYELRCAECDHEIEFGWSHPDRGGRVWPCESTDFNPWMAWSEPRFVEAWKRRGWLRPRHM